MKIFLNTFNVLFNSEIVVVAYTIIVLYQKKLVAVLGQLIFLVIPQGRYTDNYR